MNLKELMAKGGFVDVAPVSKEITWDRTVDGVPLTDTFTVFIKKQSFGAIEAIYGNETDKSKMSKYISETVRLGAEGTEEITYEQAMQLDPGLGTLLIKAINEVNGAGRTEPKN